MSNETDAAGWGKSPASRKWHYFPAAGIFSLCGGIGFYFGPREEGGDDSPDNCAACRKKLLAQRKAKPAEGGSWINDV